MKTKKVAHEDRNVPSPWHISPDLQTDTKIEAIRRNGSGHSSFSHGYNLDNLFENQNVSRALENSKGNENKEWKIAKNVIGGVLDITNSLKSTRLRPGKLAWVVN